VETDKKQTQNLKTIFFNKKISLQKSLPYDGIIKRRRDRIHVNISRVNTINNDGEKKGGKT